MILICYVLSIFCKASGDAMSNTGHKFWGHPLQLMSSVVLVALFILALIAQPYYTTEQIILIGLSYFALRFFLFDYIWNIFAHKRLGYIGTTSLYDKILRRINPAMVNLAKFVFGILAIVFLIL